MLNENYVGTRLRTSFSVFLIGIHCNYQIQSAANACAQKALRYCSDSQWQFLYTTAVRWYTDRVVTKMVSSQFMTLLRFGTIIFRYIDLLVRVVHLHILVLNESSASLWGLKTLCCCWLNQSSAKFIVRLLLLCTHNAFFTTKGASSKNYSYQPPRVNVTVHNADSICCMIFEARLKLI